MIVERDGIAALADKPDELISTLSAGAGKVGLAVPCEPRRARDCAPCLNTGLWAKRTVQKEHSCKVP